METDVRSTALPSVILPFSSNIALHPKHQLFEKIRVIIQERIPVNVNFGIRMFKDRFYPICTERKGQQKAVTIVQSEHAAVVLYE